MRPCFSINGEFDNFIIFDVDNTSSAHTDNRKKNTLVIGEGPADGLEDTAITVEAKYLVNISKSRKRIGVYMAMQQRVFCMSMVCKSISSKQRSLR